MAADIVLLALAFAVTSIGDPGNNSNPAESPVVWAFPLATIFVLGARGMYRPGMGMRPLDVAGQVIVATAIAALGTLAAVTTFIDANEGAALSRAWLSVTVFLGGGRALIAGIRRRARAAHMLAKPTVIIGAGAMGGRIEERFLRDPGIGVEVVGFLDQDPDPAVRTDRSAPLLGVPADLERVIAERAVQHVVFAFSTRPDHEILPLVRRCHDMGLDVSVLPRLFEVTNRRVKVEHVGGLPLLRIPPVHHGDWQLFVKHAIDRVGAALLLTLLAPLLLTIALAVKLSSQGPVVFRQLRIGGDGSEFEMLKFRSMRVPRADQDAPSPSVVLDPAEAPGGVEGDDRRTRVGTLIRRTSLDELPQLINVIRGQMSLVGPRPERPHFVRRFSTVVRRYDDRLRFKSGVTGWAQVNGMRGKGSIADRLELDNFYIENWSLVFDLKILLMTILAPLHKAE